MSLQPLAHPRFSVSASSVGVAIAILVQFVAVVWFNAALATRVEAVEVDTAPVRAGKVAVLEERVAHIQADVAWIRKAMENREAKP